MSSEDTLLSAVSGGCTEQPSALNPPTEDSPAKVAEPPKTLEDETIEMLRQDQARAAEPPKHCYCCYKGEAEAAQLRMCASHYRDRENVNKALLARGKREAFEEAAQIADGWDFGEVIAKEIRARAEEGAK